MDTRPETVSQSAPPALFLRNRNFRLLWVGSITATLGGSIGGVIISWIVYSTTHNALAITAVGIATFGPTLVFGVLAGALVDRWDRRRLIVSCNAGRAASYGVLALLVLLVGVSVPIVVVCTFVTATLSTISRPARRALLPRLLPPHSLTDGNGLLMSGTTIAALVGSPLGGVTLVAGAALLGSQAQAAFGLGIDATTEALAGALVALMVISVVTEPVRKQDAPKQSLVSDVREGMRFLRTQEALLTLTIVSMVTNFFFMMFNGYEVVYVAVQLHLGVTAFGVLLAMGSMGIAVGSLLPGRLRTDRAPGVWAAVAWGAAGLPLIGLALTASFLPSVLFFFAWGCVFSLGNTSWLSATQRSVPSKFLGRYFALDEAISFAMIPAGQVVGGLTILAVGVGQTFLVAGVGVAVSSFALLASAAVRGWARTGQSPEQSRASDVLVHQHDLARGSPEQLRDGGEPDREHSNPEGAEGEGGAGPEGV